ncbi:oligopeptide transport system ATP-binding protein [Roseomonas rosea]|uniref:Oligopeptide transport system ATP-binding protein n=1 Tax=Muricoccus roseus TaxID=198092 RepID=A0A1M6LUP4_9PROT|nr:ABC transporter ATP-binding protein [Roseomonas rosea]SHJ74832.1 oligopeptide transport system ATP-binding protein [Roseomonas rosea]
MSGVPGEPVLRVEGLRTVFETPRGTVTAVADMDLSVHAGETVAVVGESGSGKSAFAYSIIRLVQSPGRVAAGRVVLGGRDILPLDEDAMRDIRGREMAMVFQEPSTSLNPLMPVGAQIAESILLHEKGVTKAQARTRTLDLLRLVGIPAPERRVDEYPHQLSGGMRQRIVIAMALACRPALLLADEPTTALDVTVQAQVLDLIDGLKAELGMGVVLITHDLGLVADHAQRVAVVYAGRKVEEGPVEQVLADPTHPYTRALLACRPDPWQDVSEPLVEIPGVVPPPLALPPGCAFAPRCVRAEPACSEIRPTLDAIGPGRQVACLVASRERAAA